MPLFARTTIKVAILLVGLLAGGWMVFDGVHVLLRGKYFGPEKPGPWSVPFARLGVDPFALGPLFVLLGVLWLVFLAATLCGQAWGWYGAIVVAVASVWYFPVGTLLTVVYVALLYFGLGRPGTWR
jgi:hypothetical protein